MEKSNCFHVMKSCKLVKKNCNGSTRVVVEYVLGNMMDSLHNMMLVKGDEYEEFPKHLETFKHHFDVLKKSGLDIASEELRDRCM